MRKKNWMDAKLLLYTNLMNEIAKKKKKKKKEMQHYFLKTKLTQDIHTWLIPYHLDRILSAGIKISVSFLKIRVNFVQKLIVKVCPAFTKHAYVNSNVKFQVYRTGQKYTRDLPSNHFQFW